MKYLYILALVIFSVASASGTNYYMSPNGSGSACTQLSPCGSFATAVPKLLAGDTLNLNNGTYTTATNGAFAANCSTTAHTGTSGAHVTIQAVNERQAFIQGNGSTETFLISNCGYWDVIGLHIEGADNSTTGNTFTGDVLAVTGSNHITIRRNILAHNNRYGNVHPLLLSNTSSSLVEENEAYFFHRWGILIYGGSTGNEIRRNYANGRGYWNLSGASNNCSPNPPGSCGYPNGGTAFSMGPYDGNGNIFENNITENTGGNSFIGINTESGASNNTMLGNVSGPGLTAGTRIDAHSGVGQPTGNSFSNNVSINPGIYGFWGRSSKSTYDHDSAFGTSTAAVGFQSDTDSCCSYSTYQFVVNNSTAQGFSAAGGTGYRISNVANNSFSFDHDNNFGNTTTYNPNSNVTNPNSDNPGFGACYLWLPDGSLLKGKGLNSSDIGANILYQYVGGILTSNKLWDTTTGAPLFAGAIVSGLNDVPNSSLINVASRLHIGQNGCAFPTSYTGGGSTTPVMSLTPNNIGFGNQTVNTASASQAATIKNVGTGSLVLNSITSSGDFSQSNNCSTTLGPNASCTVNIIFTPTASGARSGTLTVTDNAAGSPHTIPLTGTGVTTIVTLSPASLTFGNQTVGTSSSSQNATLTNSGSSTLNLASISFANPDANFIQVASGPSRVTGSLAGSLATPSGTQNLTTLGTLDWAHWGLTSATSYDHKLSGIAAQISNYVVVGAGPANRYADNIFGFTWTNGTPTATATASTTGVYQSNVNGGFQITAPADTAVRTLVVYVDAFHAQGKIVAHLSDNSAADYVNTGLNSTAAAVQGSYSFTYSTTGSGQTLTVTYTDILNNSADGNVALESATLGGTSTSIASPFLLSQTAGNTNVAAIGWQDTAASISSVTDTSGNAYILAASPTTGTGLRQAMYYAKNIVGGNNTVTVTFNQAAVSPDVRVAEYNNVDKTSPFDSSSSLTGTGTFADSGPAATTGITDLLVAAGITNNSFQKGGTGYTTRTINAFGNILEDRNLPTGTYNATAIPIISSNWVMQLAAFKGIQSSVNQNDFTQTNNCGFSVAPNSSCTITIQFQPQATGSRSAVLTVIDNAPERQQTMAVSGTGTAPTPTVSLAPSSLTFSPQLAGSTSAGQIVTLTNTGNASLTINSTAISGDFAKSTNCTATLAANANCTFTVTFTPTTIGSRTGTLTVNDNASGSPHTVALTGTGIAATASFNPTSVAFGSLTVGQTSPATTVTLTDSGTADLQNIAVSLTGTNPGDFLFTNNCSSTLTTGSNCTVSAQFAPITAGARSANLHFVDSASDSPQDIPLTGTGVAAVPIATISPSSLTFSSTTVGVTSASQDVTLQNTGTATLNITSIVVSGDFAISANTCGSTLAASASCIASITFTPTTTGARSGTLSFTDDATGSPQTVSLGGTGTAPTAPVATITPSSLTFANQIINTTSSAQAVTLHNTGNATLNITSITPSGDFAISSNACGSTLTAGNSCIVNISFTPTATGSRSGNLTFVDNAAGSPQTIPLTGTGVSAPQPFATISPSSLTFGNQTVNTTSSSQAVTLQNTGNATLTITSIGTTGDFASPNNCSASLAASASCIVNVNFTPTATGARSGTLVFTDDASGSPQSVTLTGTGTAVPTPIATISPSSLSFPNTTVGVTSNSLPVTLQNTGSASLSIASIIANGDFSQSNNCGSNLAASATCTINVSFTPSTTGPRNGTLVFTDNAAGSPQTVTLTGTGVAPAAPIAVITPSSLAFSGQIINTTSSSMPVSLQNTGNANLVISSIVTSGDFAQTNNCSTLAPSASCTVNVTFTPTAVGSRSGNLSFTDNANGSPQTVSLTGTGVPAPQPIATISPSSLTFANQTVGTTSTNQDVTLQNTGNATLNITSIGTTGDFADTTTCGSTLAASASCIVHVTFSPTAAGTRNGTLKFTDDASGSPQSVTLTGTGLAAFPAVSLNPTSLDLGTQQVGSTSPSKTSILSNTGTSTLHITSIVITGTNAADYSLTNPCGATVASGANCTLSVTFTPSNTGTRTAAITITDDAAGSPHSVTLTGQGVPVPTPQVSFNPTTLTFSSQATGTSSSAQTVTLTNVGSANLTISNSALTGTNSGDYSFSTTCPATIAPSASCTYSLIFTPTAAGTRTANLSVTDNAAGSPQTVPLSGTAFVPTPIISINPAALTFSGQNVGTSSFSQPVTISNTGTGTLTFSSISISGNYSQTNNCGASIAVNGSCVVNVTFTPTAVGTRNGTLTITDNASGSPHTVSLSGTGLGSIGNINPSSLAFGNQGVGTASVAQNITLSNSGNIAQTVAIGFSGTNAADFSETDNCTGSLAAGANCSIAATFNPSATGAKNASLVITGNATNSPQNVSLTGTGVQASLSIVPTLQAFGNQPVGTSSGFKTSTVTNVGSAVANISSVTLTGQNSVDFLFGTNTCGANIQPNSSCQILVQFKPVSIGTKSASITIVDNAPSSPHNIALTGTGTSVIAVLNPTSIAFGNQPVNTQSAGSTSILSNNGTADYAITSIAIGSGGNPGDFSQTNNCPGTLVPATNCTITAKFLPTAAGSRSGAVNIVGSVNTSLPLTGSGTVPGVSFSPASLAWGNQIIATSVTKGTTLTNTGLAALKITGTSLIKPNGSPSTDYSQTSNCPMNPATLNSNSSCTFNVTFSPAAVGESDSSLQVLSNAATSPDLFSLTGAGIAPLITLTPTTFDFGNVAIGTVSGNTTFAVLNSGNGPAVISSVTETGSTEYAIQSQNCVGTLAISSICTIDVNFTPTTLGVRTATITVADNAIGNPHSSTLRGTSVNAPGPSSLVLGGQMDIGGNLRVGVQ